MTYEGVVVDLDGTVYRGDQLLPGVADGIRELRARGLQVVFVSNNPTRSRAEYADRLRELGVDAAPDDVVSAVTVTRRFLETEHAGDRVFLIGSSGLRRRLETAPVTLVEDATTADVLVVSYARSFDYGDLLAGYRALEAGARFLGTDPDLLVPAAEGLVPGSGAIINAVGGVIDREPDAVLGKPSSQMCRAVEEALDVPVDRCLVVGDRLATDIAMGERAGMTSVLVRTGVATDMDVAASEINPDYVLDSLADIETVLSDGPGV